MVAKLVLFMSVKSLLMYYSQICTFFHYILLCFATVDNTIMGYLLYASNGMSRFKNSERNINVYTKNENKY